MAQHPQKRGSSHANPTTFWGRIMTRLGDATYPATSGGHYYVHTNSWPAHTGGPEMSTADIDAALASMGNHYDAAVKTFSLTPTSEATKQSP